ncbi:PH domain-containing protein [Streptomyces profundus]|uniref:PH domain-containing protein n=1 Tax=Streptomyces profundus TaxID=2867410 RepID=UPI001D16FB05|nr:PH domain-containing protein [Streptomyces sp. MA3_2.13]UED87198.1 PH domain-containing protein [Streptomyces sp. MA3_2.13]
MTGGDGAAGQDATAEPAAEWRRLDTRIIRAVGVWGLLLVVVTVAILWWRGVPWWVSALVPVPVLGLLGYETFRWFKTWYRVTPEHIELKTGLLTRSHRSIPRQRVRSVDVTANPVHRMLGIATVAIGTGHRVSSTKNAVLTLDALPVADAEALRARLLRNSGAGEARPLARIDWRWTRFAPLSFGTPLLGLGALGFTYETLDLLGADPDNVLIPDLIDWLGGADLLLVIPLFVLGYLLAGAVGTLGWYVEMWWNFRLVREEHGALRATRGLLVTRSATLEEERLRGVEIAEPLLLRWGGGAYTYAVATGSGTMDEETSSFNTSALLPPAPVAESHRVAAIALREDEDPTSSVRLIRHTGHALRRRLLWTFWVGTAIGAVLVLLGVLLTPVLAHIGWISALAVYATGAPFAVDGYRNLGHGITGRYLVTRHGSLKRRTIALRRDGVIGWQVTQWVWHRKSGLCRLTATTAGGRGAYDVKDVLLGEGLRFADEAVPELLGQFLVSEGHGGAEGPGTGGA